MVPGWLKERTRIVGDELETRLRHFCGRVFSTTNPVFDRGAQKKFYDHVRPRTMYDVDEWPWGYISAPAALRPMARAEHWKWFHWASHAKCDLDFSEELREEWDAKIVSALYLVPASLMVRYGLKVPRCPGQLVVQAACLYASLALPEQYMAQRDRMDTATRWMVDSSKGWIRVWENAKDYIDTEPHWECATKPRLSSISGHGHQGDGGALHRESEKKESVIFTLWTISQADRQHLEEWRRDIPILNWRVEFEACLRLLGLIPLVWHDPLMFMFLPALILSYAA